MDETDRPDERRAAGSWVLPNSESRRQRNHEASKSGIPKRKKTETHPRLSCKIEYLLRSNHRDRSIASKFFTDDSVGSMFRVVSLLFARLGICSAASPLRHHIHSSTGPSAAIPQRPPVLHPRPAKAA